MANSGRLILPKNLNSVTRDLVKRILVADPELRIDIKGIMKHRFFADVDWSLVQSKQVTPPYVPPSNHLINTPAIMTANSGASGFTSG